MKSPATDLDRDDVYFAEQLAFCNTLFAEPLHSDDFMALADRLFTHDWWERHRIPVPVIEPTTSKDSTSYAEITYGCVQKDPIIRIAPRDICPWILAHEAAHIAQYYFYSPDSYGPIESHGREFRATYLVVAEIVLGRDAAHRLRDRFEWFVNLRPEHTPGQPGSILCVPKSKPEHDPKGLGLFPTWRLEQQMKTLDRMRPAVSSAPRLNGAIAL